MNGTAETLVRRTATALPRSSRGVLLTQLLTWGLALVTTSIGSVLLLVHTANGWAETATGSGEYVSQSFALWPAGLVLLGVGTAGLIATAIAQMFTRADTNRDTSLPAER